LDTTDEEYLESCRVVEETLRVLEGRRRAAGLDPWCERKSYADLSRIIFRDIETKKG
jgi:hypothetical protein